MSQAIRDALTIIEQEIEAIDQRRGELLRAIDAIRPLAGEDAPPTPPTRARRPKTVTATRAPRRMNGAAVAHTNGTGEAILATLKKHGGVMKPGALAKALKLTPGTLRYQMKPLEGAKQILVTGVTAGRRVSLPGARAAKEAP